LKQILIIAPHFPPSNLAGVHRSRLFAQHLPAFGWDPIILTVDEKYYEEEPDLNLEKLLPAKLKIEKVKAFGISKPRFVGDIGLRAFFQLYKRAKQIINDNQVDFLYIPIPSFYCALLGRLLFEKTKVKYGIDYIDPWVHEFPGSNKIFSRHWFSKKFAELLEPFAVRKASLITGVASGYYEAVLRRNPELSIKAVTGAMPYGGEISDHAAVKNIDSGTYLFTKENSKIKFVYAGAMLPKSYKLLEEIFKSIVKNSDNFQNLEFHFIGTGKSSTDPTGYNIKPLAEEYGLWQKVVFEYPKRIPYLDVLVHLDRADAVFILGSTEPHYTPSKVYQAVLSEKPILAILHAQSTAVDVIRKSKAGIVLTFDGEHNIEIVHRSFLNTVEIFLEFKNQFHPDQVDKILFENYSANKTTEYLVQLLEKACTNSSL